MTVTSRWVAFVILIVPRETSVKTLKDFVDGAVPVTVELADDTTVTVIGVGGFGLPTVANTSYVPVPVKCTLQEAKSLALSQ